MKHPNPECQERQEDFLEQCPAEEREFHARLFRIGNTAYRYHQLSAAPQNKDSLKSYYREWLEGLQESDPGFASIMQKKGFEECKTISPFTRYVNERTDIGMDEWMQRHLSKEDYKYYRGTQL